MPISKTVVIVSSIAMLIIGLLAGYFIGQSVTSPGQYAQLRGEIPIGVMLCDTIDGANDRPTTEIVQEEINDYLQSIGINATFKFLIEDPQGSATKALEKAQTLVAEGVKVILDWRCSSHIQAVKGYADSNHILIVSCGSTSPALAIPDDYIFRFVPDDTKQAKAIVRILMDQNIKAVVVMQRGDAWGDGIYGAFNPLFTASGGVIADYIRYDPDATEFSTEVSKAASSVRGAAATYGWNHVGFLILTFQEQVVPIQQQAGQYPELLNITWFGSDGHALSEPLVKEAGELAVRVKHVCTYFAATQSEKYQQFRAKFVAKAGMEPQSYTVNLYDSAWVVALSTLIAGKYDANAIKKVLPQVASSYFGASGWTLLNDAGDRAGGNYAIWIVAEENGTIQWKNVGYYDFVSDSVKWLA